MPDLRPYQIEALEASDTDPNQRQLIIMPTGTGKTVLFAQMARNRMVMGRVLILVHRDELVRQTLNKLRDAGLSDIGIIQADLNIIDKPVTVASVQTLSRPVRLAAFAKMGKMETLIIDEAHHAPAPTYRDIIDTCLSPTGRLIGLTATPDRDMKGSARRRNKGDMGHSFSVKMADVFDGITYYRSLSDMVGEGWLCDLLPGTIETSLGLSDVKMSAGDWQASDLGAHMQAAQAETDIVTAWSQVAKGRPTLAFLPTVEMSRTLAAEFEQRGYAAEHVDGMTPIDQRQDTYRRLRDGRTNVVCNCMVLTEGFDEPSVSCVIVARPTKSRGLFAQMIGRGTRLFPNKTDCLVLSVVDHDLDLEPVKLQDLMADHEWQDGQTLSERQEEIADKATREAKERTDEEQAAFLFRQAFKQRTAARLNWRKIGATWRLNLGSKGWLALSLEGTDSSGRELWIPILPQGFDVPTEPSAMTLEAATAWAEHCAEASDVKSLIDPEASWRQLPATDKQVTLAKRWGIDPTGLSRGQLSDLLVDKQAEAPTDKQVSYARRLGWTGDPRTSTKRDLIRWIAANAPARRQA